MAGIPWKILVALWLSTINCVAALTKIMKPMSSSNVNTKDSIYSESDMISLMQDTGVHDVPCSPIWCQDKEVVSAPDSRSRHIELSMREARLLQLKPSDLE